MRFKNRNSHLVPKIENVLKRSLDLDSVSGGGAMRRGGADVNNFVHINRLRTIIRTDHLSFRPWKCIRLQILTRLIWLNFLAMTIRDCFPLNIDFYWF